MLAILIGILVLTFGLTFAFEVEQQQELILQQARQQASTLAHALLSSLQTLMLAGDGPLAHDWLKRVRSHADLDNVEVLRRDGSEAFRDLATIGKVNAFLGTQRFHRQAISPFVPHDLDASSFQSAAGGRPMTIQQGQRLTFLLPIHKDARCNACHGYDPSPIRGVLRVSVSTRKAMALVGRMRMVVGFAAAGGMLLLTLLAYVVVRRRVLVPIMQMTEATDAIAAGNLDARVDTRAGDEIAMLGFAFNHMTEILQQTTVSKHYVDEILHCMGDMLFVIDPGGRIALANPAAAQALGYAQQEMVGLPVGDIVTDASPLVPEEKEGTGSVESRFMTKDGQTIPVLVSVSRLEADGRHHQIIYAARDITRQKAAERELRLAAKVMDTVSNAIMVADAEANICLVNPAFCRITGYRPEEVLGKNPRILQSGRQNREFYAGMWQTIQDRGLWEGEIWNRRKDGEIYPEWLTITAMHDRDGKVTHYVSTFQDITERKRVMRELEHLASHDQLTGLPNRKLFIDRLQHAMRLSRRVEKHAALLFIDIDGFKPINDAHGHDIGDALLQAIAARLRTSVRDSDTVARLGGDEFTVIMENVGDIGHVLPVADKILDALNAPFTIGDVDCRIGASIGISVYPDDSEELDDLIKKADTAMYLAKHGGRNQICVYSRDCRSAEIVVG